MKIIFVEPLAQENVFSSYMNLPLLGPLYLAAILKKNGYDVKILNENILKRKVRMNELDADILCITSLTTTIERAYEIAKQFKANNPNSRVIIGGIHASFVKEEVAKFADHVIIGEGEKIILDIVKGRIKDKFIYGQPVENLDEIPIPDFSLLEKSESIDIMPVMTSRGCPHGCVFCSVTKMFGRRFRINSIGRVIEELKRIKQKEIFFYDDHFAAIKNRLHELLDRMIKENINKKWSAQVRVDVANDKELVKKMSDAGCKWVYAGLESVNPETLKQYNKAQTVKDIKYSIKTFHDYGINVHGMFVLGSDADDKSVFRQTSDFCDDYNIDTVQYNILTPIPGSSMMQKLENENRLLHKRWKFYDGLHVVFKPKKMTALELQTGTLDAFKDFYSYSKGVKEFLNEALFSGINKIKTAFSNVKMPSFSFPYKFIGRNIIRRWVRQNIGYLDYLRKPNLLKSIS
jgi:radical SAM superfamily enzyme YgiQ (UPF0313 family)